MRRCQSGFFRGRKPSKRHQPAILMTSSEASAFLVGCRSSPMLFPIGTVLVVIVLEETYYVLVLSSA